MVRKTKNQADKTVLKAQNTPVVEELSTGMNEDATNEDAPIIDVKTDTKFTVLLEAQASKLSPKSVGHISFQLVRGPDNLISIRLVANTSGGNFCKNPISLQSIITILEHQTADKAFKSSIMKDVFIGKGSKSSNNMAFLISALRSPDIGLIIPNDKSKFLSNISKDFADVASKLLTQ
jgi:hypothetical protein